MHARATGRLSLLARRHPRCLAALSTSSSRPVSKPRGGRPKKQEQQQPDTSIPREAPAKQTKSILDDVDRIMKEREKERLSLSTEKHQSSGKESIFEVFKIPDPPSPRDPDSFDADACEAYAQIIDSIMLKEKFLRRHTRKPIRPEDAAPVIKWLKREKLAIGYDLPEFTKALMMGVKELDGESNSREQFAREIAKQRKGFIEHTGFTKNQYKMAAGAIVQAANLCAKHKNGQAVAVVWEKMKEAGIADKRALHALLHVSSTVVIGNRRRRTRYERLVDVSILDVLDDVDGKSESDEAENYVETTDELAVYHDLLHEPTEQSVGVRVKLLVAQGKAKEAERLLDSHSTSTELRLRAYAPVLLLHLELNDVAAALKLYQRMRGMPLVHLEAETYIQILTGLIERGCFAANSSAIVNAKELGYSEDSGPGLFDEIVAEMAHEIVEIPETLARRLDNALARGFPSSNLPTTSSLEQMKISTSLATGDEVIASRVQIDLSTGLCPRSGVFLKLIRLSAEDREQLKTSILSLAREHQISFEKEKQIKGRKAKANDGLEDFLRAMDERRGDPFTAIVDGPNVGYYMQNFETGRFNFHQIKYVVDSLERLGEHPLVVLPRKYANKSFIATIGSNNGRRQFLTRDEVTIIQELRERGMVYVVPAGFLDDYYWILASVADQTTSRKGRSLSVASDNPEGRWPGERPVLVTNDQMRDHRLAIAEPILFRRWHSNYIVNYDFPAFVNAECSYPEISFGAADAFSREIQSNKGSDGATVWHFPLSGTENEWFCIRLPKA